MTISRAERDLQFAERLAKLLDTSVRLPGTRFRFGLDPLIGLFPFVGDIITLVMSLLLVAIALRNGAGGKLVVMMIGNILVDTLGGSIPLIGAIFDFFYKSNTKNLELLREHILEKKHTGSGKGLVLGALILLLGLFIALVYLIGIIISGFFHAFPEVYNWLVELFS
ncbi:uncharacterized protein DUF4112 [Anseongella ginsenosidimutans]|uniref:Uncharacterized protein DUF4112 n=1 Tax=Anseongella ginsenosidimutans TaxID=496056 RepID=A0A4R3KXF5_9SPHI|nr:DUF4112 domain-containing protein [Anseongella ginsenosidimutans]QEC51199.1 DUF4112 domain-containing protein [Anseongella ginsenosidimutans]TCS90128.1 uncharacterized protein DUF4112 [Anseongella ginsenosidimutans]